MSVHAHGVEMNRTAYLPLRQFKKEEIVPTVKADYLRKGKVLQGYVHDESAAFMVLLTENFYEIHNWNILPSL